jgi:peptide/nickel transport system permease protein
MANGSSERVAQGKERPWLVFFTRLVKEKPLGTAGAVITLLLLFTGIFADLLAPYGMNEQIWVDKLVAPSAGHWLGTDHLGRDILSRVIYGARVSVIVGFAATTLSTINSVILGMLSGYIGGKFDLIVQRFVDAWMALPGLILLMVIMSFIGPGIMTVIIALGVLGGFTGSRVIRGATMAIKENVYIEASKAVGNSTARTLFRHILPNIMAPIIISFSTRIPGVILTEASLSFLGFGIPPPIPSWGGMLSGRGREFMFLAPWMVIWPGLALSIVVYGVNMLGDAVRDLLDPKLRGGVERYGVSATKEPTIKR